MDILSTILDQLVAQPICTRTEAITILSLISVPAPGLWSLLWEQCFSNMTAEPLKVRLRDGYGNEIARLVLSFCAAYKKYM